MWYKLCNYIRVFLGFRPKPRHKHKDYGTATTGKMTNVE